MKFGMYYNKETIGDVLLVIYKSDVIPAYVEQRNDIVALFDKDNEIVGYNFLNISNSMKRGLLICAKLWRSASRKSVQRT